MKKLISIILAIVMVTAFFAVTASAEGYPAKTVTIICPFSAGGGADLMHRAVAPFVADSLGCDVVVVNKTGAGGAVGFAAGAKEKADGSSVTSANAELLSVPYSSDVDFDYRSFRPICNMTSSWGVLCVNASSDFTDLQSFIDYCKEHPGEVRFSNSGVGSIWHWIAGAFAYQADIDIVHVPFEGGATAAAAVAGNNVEACIVTPEEIDPFVQTGDARILCIFKPDRLESLPDVPTASELGLEIPFSVFRGAMVPKDTPEEICVALEAAFKRAIEEPEVIKYLENGKFTIDWMSGDDLWELWEAQDAVYTELAPILNIKAG